MLGEGVGAIFGSKNMYGSDKDIKLSRKGGTIGSVVNDMVLSVGSPHKES